MIDKTYKIHKVRVAQYLRMSTNLQEFSLDNQAQFIKKYADEHDMEIVHTYDDAGKSGVSTTGRHDFNKLVNDVLTKDIIIDAVLVYDVSRFGRFKDPQEGIYYKYLLKMHNVDVIYCAENLPENSETETFILSSLMYAAGAFSKNLSIKVFAGHMNLVKRGYYQGGKPGYGLKRKLLDNNNKPKMILAHGERKSLQTDRIVLVPGTKKEIELIKKIFNMFIFDGLNEYLIASRLNQEGYRFSDKTEWTRGRIHSVLINSRYTGRYIYNRTSQKLKTKRIKNPEEDWVEYNSFFKPIISEEKFRLAKEIIDNRSIKMSDEKILDCLRKILSKHGKISGFIIDEENSSPSSSVIANRFGGLLNAYKLIDYTPERDYQYLEINSYLRKKHCDIVNKIQNEIISSELMILGNKLISVNKALSFSIVLSRCKKTSLNKHRWVVRLDRSLNPEISIIARMNSLNTEPVDYYILPSIELIEQELKLKDNNNILFEMYRFDDIKPFFNMLSTDDKDVI
ncbi:MAG: recombinase family protein [Pantoea sp.]|uniref:recombinase family protein n=1 Tax=Pantoea sp. TaxID=69393 RepID=UPI0039E4B826